MSKPKMSQLARFRNALRWGVLTASTIGPGSVALSAKAGANFNQALLWCILVATLVSWMMQDAAGYLAVRVGISLGQGLRKIAPSGMLALLRFLLMTFVLVGSLAYECNIFSGTMSAIRIVTNNTAVNLVIALFNGPLCIFLALSGSVDNVASALGIVSILMVVMFAATISIVGLQPGLARGIIPSLPEGSVATSLAVMGTTAVPLNLFLGSSLARGSSFQFMREGVASASVLTGVICTLIQAVGTYIYNINGGEMMDFDLVRLGNVLRELTGDAGAWCFAIGLYGAGISSALTIPLGSAIAVGELMGWNNDAKFGRRCSSWATGGRTCLMCAIIIVGTIPSLCNLPTMPVIMLAQLVNGMLLPFAASCLVICVNHRSIMGSHMYTMWGNLFLAPCLFVVFFLASMVLLEALAAGSVQQHLLPAALLTCLNMACLSLFVRRARNSNETSSSSTRGCHLGCFSLKNPLDRVRESKRRREWTPKELEEVECNSA